MPIQEKYQNLHVIYWDLQGQKKMMNLRSCVNMLLKIKNIMLIFLKILKKDLMELMSRCLIYGMHAKIMMYLQVI